MRVALINPRWSFDGSIYFGCREPHLPLELGYCKALLEASGHDAFIIDCHMEELADDHLRARVAALAPDATVVTTAPTYLFWRCAQPELRVPRRTVDAVRDVGGLLIAVGPHGSTTPRATLRKLGVDVVVMGEAEEVVVALLAQGEAACASICRWSDDGKPVVQGGPHASAFVDLPALRWPADWVRRHGHHHHRFDPHTAAPGAEVEASRGCPYHCSFCAKDNFRDRYRRRDLALLLDEIDGLAAQGAAYLYFIDEIFLPNRALLTALVGRGLSFGVQTRIDLWTPDMLELLGRAGCVSIEAGIESITREGRAALEKECRLTTAQLTERLVFAKRHVPFVQANLIGSAFDDDDDVALWRGRLRDEGVWANVPVPLFPYPGAPDYRRLWGEPDDRAWERALGHYLGHHAQFSDIQDDRPLPLAELERECR